MEFTQQVGLERFLYFILHPFQTLSGNYLC